MNQQDFFSNGLKSARVDERSSDTYTGRDDFLSFFLGKIVQAQIVFPVWVLISFSVKFLSFVKKNASSTIEQ